MKIRIKFRRYGNMKFLGHLDMMRYFQKAIRRAEIDICYSEGYSPHQIMSFAAPLGVGITSDGEYFDIEVHSSVTSDEAVAALNATMVEGIEVTGYVLLPDKAKTAMAIVSAADYKLSYKEGYDCPVSYEKLLEVFQETYFNQDSFMIIKKTKKSEKEMDIKPLVYDLKIEKASNGTPEFFLKVSTGSIDNMKPELVISSIYEKAGIAYDSNAIQIHRMEVYATDSETNNLVSLLDMGNTITERIS